MSPSATEPTVARFWTRARRFPRLIGKTVNGDRIPGGPYTTAQAIGGFLTVWLLWETRPLWETGSIIAELALIAGAGWGVVWSLGKVPLNTKNPIILAGGLLQAVFSPRRGRAAGRGVAEREFGSGMRPLFGNQPAPVWNGRLPGVPFGPSTEAAADTPASGPLDPVDPMGGADPAPAAPPRWSAPGADESSSGSSDRALTGLQRLLADAARTPDDAAATGRRSDGADDWVSAGHRVRRGGYPPAKGDQR